MSQGAMIARILTQYSDKGSNAAKKDIKKLSADFEHFAKRAKVAFGVAAAASAAFAVKVGIDSVKAAMEDQKSQALLANSLRNTAGATDAAIAAVEAHIDKQQALLGVTDEELRPSMISLAAATHNVAAAQRIQNVALDLAAGRGKDLAGVSLALAKAYAGNFTALRKLGIPISENIIKTKDFNGLLNELSASVGGAASTAANTFAGHMLRMQIGIDKVREKLGFAFLPVLEKMVGLLVSDVIPKIQKWVDLNKEKLARGLQTAATFVYELTKRAFAFGAWISNHMGQMRKFAAILAGLFVGSKVLGFITLLGAVAKAFTTLKFAAVAAGIAEGFATGGASVALGLVGAATIAATMAAYNLAGGFTAAADAAASIGGVAPTYMGGLIDAKGKTASDRAAAALKKSQAAAKKFAAEQLKMAKELAATQAKSNKAAADAAAKELATQKGLAALKGLGIKTTTETDPIQLEAARQNLVKQALLLRSDETNAALKALAAQLLGNTAIQRYADIMATLKDGKITDTEIVNLGVKWGLSTKAVQDYITKAIGDFSPKDKDPAIGIKSSWQRALDAVNAYISGLNKIPTITTGNNSTVFPTVTAPTISPTPTPTIAPSYVSPSDLLNSNGSLSGRGAHNIPSESPIYITVQGSLLDQGGLVTAVQNAVQQVVRNGSSLSGSSSRGDRGAVL